MPIMMITSICIQSALCPSLRKITIRLTFRLSSRFVRVCVRSDAIFVN